MADVSDITVGIKTFYRPEKLEIALRSFIGANVKEIIVADDGPDDPIKNKMYDELSEYLPLKVIQLPYDSGLAYGRNAIFKHTKTPYLLIIDDDMEIPDKHSLAVLKDILMADESLGGISAMLLENGRVRSGAHNLSYRRGYLIRDVPSNIRFRFARGIPYILFDQILNAALFRVECLKDYSWDDYYKINFEHLDFYWGHKQLGKWRFGVTPAVIFKHNPGGDVNYMGFRLSKDRYVTSKKYFLNKWKLKGIVNIQSEFLYYDRSLKSVIWTWLKKHAPFRLLPYLMWIEEWWAHRLIR